LQVANQIDGEAAHNVASTREDGYDGGRGRPGTDDEVAAPGRGMRSDGGPGAGPPGRHPSIRARTASIPSLVMRYSFRA
jgi:hypothetical protein